MDIRKFFAATFLIAVLSVSTAVNAALVEQDYFTTGDNLISYDAVTNLQWLDITQTFNLSYDEVLSGTGNSWYADGWRYATTDEVVEMVFNHTGIDVGCGGCTTHTYTTVSVEIAADLINLIGANPDGHLNAFFDNGTLDKGAGQFAVNHISSVIIVERWNGVSRESSGPGIGSVLVKAVPIPSALYLFGSGLIGLIGIAKRKKA